MFKVQQAFWGVMRMPGVERLCDLSLECLPTEAADLSLGQSDVRLARLSSSKRSHFCGTSMQSILASTHGVVVAMAQGRAPNMAPVTDSHFIVNTKIAMGRFCTHQETETFDDKKVTTKLHAKHLFDAK